MSSKDIEYITGNKTILLELPDRNNKEDNWFFPEISNKIECNIIEKVIRPKYSIIIPVFNREDCLKEVLDKIFTLNYQNYEVIIIDDGSTDNSIEIAKGYPCRIQISINNSGPAHARNLGASIAQGDILVFVDSDVLLPADTLDIIERKFQDPRCMSVMGYFSPDMYYNNFASNYKNLYMSYMFKILPKGTSNCFFTSIAAIKKDIFFSIGIFDYRFNKMPCEDLEFGNRINNEYKINICNDLLVKHLKYYNLWELLKTDFQRAEAIAIMLFRNYSKTNESFCQLTAPRSFIIGIGFTGLGFFFLIPGILINSGFIFLSLFSFLGAILVNLNFIKFIKRIKGWLLSLKTIAFLLFDFTAMGLGCVQGILKAKSTVMHRFWKKNEY